MAIDGTLLQQAGQGDAFILPAANTDRLTERLDTMKMEQQRKAAAEQKAREERDRKLDELMKWNPEQAWYPHTEQLNNKVRNVYDYATQIRMQGGATPEDERRLKQLQWDANVTAKKSQDVQNMYGQFYKQIDQGSDQFTDKKVLFSKLNDWAFGQDGNKDVNTVDFEAANTLFDTPEAFKKNDYVAHVANQMPSQIESTFGQVSVDGGSVFVDKEVKSKFFDLDKNGNIKYKDGKPIVKITDELVNYAMGDRRYADYIARELAKPGNEYLTAKDIVKKDFESFASREEKQNVSKGFSDKDTGKDEQVNMISTFDVERNFNLGSNAPDPNNPVQSGWAPHEIRLSGKKMDKPVNVNAKYFFDPTTNEAIQNVGDKPITITRLVLRPVDKNNNRFIINSKDKVQNFGSSIEYRWFAEGSYQDDADGEKTTKQVVIPYDDVKTDLDAAYGINLENRDISDYSDYELTSLINKNYPKASAQEKLEIFKQLRDSK